MAAFEYTDVDYAMNIDRRGNVVIKRGRDAIIQSLRMLLASYTGEYVRSLKGSRILRYIGRNMNEDTVQDIREEIINMIRVYEQRVEVIGVRVEANYDDNTYDIRVSMRELETQQPFLFETRLRSLGN